MRRIITLVVILSIAIVVCLGFVIYGMAKTAERL